jgi:hypothetical protein
MPRCFPLLFLCCALGQTLSSPAQEFPPGFVGYLEFHQGLNTSFHGRPDLFVGGLDFRPQVTVIPDHLRLGLTAGAVYTDTHLDLDIGPTAALKICTFSVSPFGTIANLQLQADYTWTTRSRQFLGGGPKLEFGQLLIIGLTVHRDFEDNAWFFQTAVGFNLFHQKRPAGPPPDPLGSHH